MSKKSLMNLIGMLGVVLLVSSCTSQTVVPPGNDAGGDKSNAKDIIMFSIGDRVAVISETDITATLPYGTDVTSLTPIIIVSARAGICPASGAMQDFTSPVIYTVTAEDGTTKVYTVTVFLGAPNIYVAGCESSGDGGNVAAAYWKNGDKTVLTDGTYGAKANSIFVSDSDVYVAGVELNGSGGNGVAEYWMNGAPTVLTDGTYNGGASSIFVSGSDVYVAGYEASGGGGREHVQRGFATRKTDELGGDGGGKWGGGDC